MKNKRKISNKNPLKVSLIYAIIALIIGTIPFLFSDIEIMHIWFLYLVLIVVGAKSERERISEMIKNNKEKDED